MQIKKIKISQIKETHKFLASYQMNIVLVEKKFFNLLNKNFKGQTLIEFGEITNRIFNGDSEKRGDIIIKNFLHKNIKVEIAQRDKQSKRIWTKYRVTDNRISPEYILWFFSKKIVRDYLSIHSSGSVIQQIPLKVFEKIKIPISKINQVSKRNLKTISLKTTNGAIRQIIKSFYKDYQINIEEKRYQTSIILAGAICEAILYETLVELGVSEDILSQNKTLGTLIEFAKIKELDKAYGISISPFTSVMKHRNKTIHIGSALKSLKKGEMIDIEVFKDFDNIIKNFGI